MKRLFVLSILFFTSTAVYSLDTAPAWISWDVPREQEQESIRKMEESGITVIGWTNAVVDVSAFEGLQLLALANLETRLILQDPRRDPWLTSLKTIFRPGSSISRIWFEPQNLDKAREILGVREVQAQVSTVSTGFTPRVITGWVIITGSSLYLILSLLTLLNPSGASLGRRWRLLVLNILLLGAAIVLTTIPGRSDSSESTSSSQVEPGSRVSWLRHHWFQRAWPYGAVWQDWVPGKAWSYLSYERRNGRVSEVRASLETPDAIWARKAFEGLDPHHAARIFGSENP